AERVRRLQAARLIGLSWDNRQPRLWLRDPADPHSALAGDVAAVRRHLDLEPGTYDFQLTELLFNRQPNQVGIRFRSLLGVLYFRSQSVELPAPHIQEGSSPSPGTTTETSSTGPRLHAGS